MHEHSISTEAWSVVDWLCYFVYGNGLWMNSLHCTSEDYCAIGFRAICCLYMAINYYRYARQWKLNFRGEPASPYKTHAMWLRTVFFWCLCIHVVGSVVFIVVPLHYLMGVMFLVNGAQCQLLCRSNLQRQTHQRWHDGENAIASQDRLADDLESFDQMLAQQQHAASIEMVNDTSRTLSAVREVLEVAKLRLDQTRKSKVMRT